MFKLEIILLMLVKRRTRKSLHWFMLFLMLGMNVGYVQFMRAGRPGNMQFGNCDIVTVTDRNVFVLPSKQ